MISSARNITGKSLGSKEVNHAVKLLIFETKAPPWVEAVRQDYQVKLSRWCLRHSNNKESTADRDNGSVK